MYHRYFKRIMDLFLALFLFFLLLPVILLIGLLIRLFLGKPVIFSQVRPGLHGKPFTLFKFRTMLDKRNKQGDLLPDEERLTLFGKWLRSFSLDELPELLNVIKGEMSFVGPRPLLMDYLPYYNKDQQIRHTIKPGITGWAQICGRNKLLWEQKFELDIWYVNNGSFFLDIKILLLTVLKIIQRDGITENGHVTMSRFDQQALTPFDRAKNND